MNLSQFIRDNRDAIVLEWETFAGTLLPAAGGMSSRALRDHAQEILSSIIEDLESPQHADEQSQKSKGHGEEHRMEAVGKAHAALRIQDGFNLGQLVAEYRALRASVLRLFEKASAGKKTDDQDLRQLTRFNESIDEALTEAASRYMLVMNRTRDQFLAILGHDLRNPLGAIMMSAATVAASGVSEDKLAKAASRILTCAQRMGRMVRDLLDLTRTRLGGGIPITPQAMDLEEMCREVLAELEAFQPDRRLVFQSSGNLRGAWDVDRLAQVLSNLVGNALQHGAHDKVIEVTGRGFDGEVVLEVHNEGQPIPPELLEHVFEPMVRSVSTAMGNASSTSLGLGLHITREIVLSHGGTVSVRSTESEGTTFTVRLPRHYTSDSAPHATRPEPLDQHDAKGDVVIPAPGPLTRH
ncbi:sensor histidine kinase [Pyxidicoccus xibeiensis]|uniref:sensor histidine kinase n=1 Tax=Pyxidicoccus xibeiensis TaxID=2906759 RepID=UPI0020A70D06|nr:sensor histidine kinase [Pyxidicoccus xibeiensis]MCP3141603.1 sensor histidine kinase [Pyxidicoccus xibeiensis]